MFSTELNVQISADFDSVSAHTLLLEIGESDFFERLEKYNISLDEDIVAKIQKNQKANPHDRESFFTFYTKNEQFFQIVLFFVNENKKEEQRNKVFRKFVKNVVYIPDGDEEQAYENFVLSVYSFDQYKTEKEPSTQIFFVEDMSKMSILESKKSLLLSVITARNLVNMPPNDFHPESFVEAISNKKWKHFDVEVFGNSELRQLGCDLIRAVGQGSARDNFMVIIKPKKEISKKKIALVGKGVTFDAGGIQIKPDKHMLDMKCDMAGAASVLGIALYLDGLEELPMNIIFGMGIAENMTGAAAFKPLDIYRAYNGKTVEIHHTDAEGRLVLADVMSYIEKNYKVEHVITLATLTGACIYALGDDIAGIIGDDEEIIEKFVNDNTLYEDVWRLPLTEKMINAVKSDIADVKNLSVSEKAGSSMGAAFLSYFCGDAKLTHIDMAGPAYRSKSLGYMSEGGTGWGIRKITKILLSLNS